MLKPASADAVKSLIVSSFQRQHGRFLCLFLLLAIILAVSCPAFGADGDSSTVTADSVIREYWYWLVIIVVILVVMTVTAVSAVKLSRRLKQTQWELKSELSERRRVEETIRKSERRFRDIAESMSDWIWEIDTNGVYTYCSRNVSDIIGYSRKDVIGKTPFDFMIPKDAERLRPYLEEIIRQRCSFRNLENWNITNNGRRVCLLSNGSPIFDDDGELTGYRGIDTDIGNGHWTRQ
jgi:PAS domain S-box-containing protein